jgi:hypothetical protein
MSLLEEWREVEESSAAVRGGGAASGAAPLFSFGAEGDDGELDDEPSDAPPMFAIETLEKDASHGQGVISAVAAAANVVLLGTASGALIRFDFAEGAATGAWLLRAGREARRARGVRSLALVLTANRLLLRRG